MRGGGGGGKELEGAGLGAKGGAAPPPVAFWLAGGTETLDLGPKFALALLAAPWLTGKEDLAAILGAGGG